MNTLGDARSSVLTWNPPPPKLAVEPGEVHVWRFRLDADAGRVEQWRGTLSDEERSRADRFLFERHRRRFIVARSRLRAVLGGYLARQPEKVQFRYGLHGKPLVEEGDDLHFNLSHSGEAGVLAVTRGLELGIDLEQVRPREHLEELAQRFFAVDEVKALSAMAPEQRELAFFLCWTRKEAFLKAGGEGLARPLDQFAVSLQPGEPARLLWVAADPQEAARWTLRSYAPWPDFVACIALRAHEWNLRGWEGDAVLGPL